MGLEVFFSYSHRDEDLRDELEKHLSNLKHQGFISAWHDRRIDAGSEWAQAIDERLAAADVILLLISADFLASDYCYGIEMKKALEQHQRREALIIPIILRPVDWHGTPFGRFQALPKTGKAITTWKNQDEAFLDVAQGIRQTVAGLEISLKTKFVEISTSQSRKRTAKFQTSEQLNQLVTLIKGSNSPPSLWITTIVIAGLAWVVASFAEVSTLISQNGASVREFFLPESNPSPNPGEDDPLNHVLVEFDTQNYSIGVFNDSGVTKIDVQNRVSRQMLVNSQTATAEVTEIAPYRCWVNYFGGGSGFDGASARYFIRVSGSGQALLQVISANGGMLLSEPKIDSSPLTINIPQADRPACFGEVGSSASLTPYIAAVFGGDNELQQVRQELNAGAGGQNFGGLTCTINPRFESNSQGQFINAAECGNRDDTQAIVIFLKRRGFNAQLIYRNINYQFDDEGSVLVN